MGEVRPVVEFRKLRKRYMNTKQLDGQSVLKSPYFIPLSMAALWNCNPPNTPRKV